jgi:phage shock protein PspC (stress-responsive transcriptional regulator)
MSWHEQFVRPRRGRVIAGVCAAIADRYGTSRMGVRVLFVASVLLPGPQFLVYLLGWALFPQEGVRLP